MKNDRLYTGGDLNHVPIELQEALMAAFSDGDKKILQNR